METINDYRPAKVAKYEIDWFLVAMLAVMCTPVLAAIMLTI